MIGPWTDVLTVTKDYTVYRDGFPVTEGHLLFVPRVEDWQHLSTCWQAAYRWGHDWVQRGYCDAFNIGQNVGEAAGQTVMYPHVHLIPRRTGDMEDPRGGVRHVIPEKGNYKKGSSMQARVKEDPKEFGRCGCGRSPTGYCVGWHGLPEEEFRKKLAEYEDTELKKYRDLEI